MRLRTKISWKLLEDSSKVYNTINYHLFFKRFVVRGAYEEIQMGDWEKDNHLFQFFVDSVNDINKGFFLLYNLKEPNSAYPLIRLQLDNLRLLFAEYLYPFKVLSQTFEKDKDLN